MTLIAVIISGHTGVQSTQNFHTFNFDKWSVENRWHWHVGRNDDLDTNAQRLRVLESSYRWSSMVSMSSWGIIGLVLSVVLDPMKKRGMLNVHYLVVAI